MAWAERRHQRYRMRLFNDKDQCDDGLKLAIWLKERSFSVSALRMIGAAICKDDYGADDYFKQ